MDSIDTTFISFNDAKQAAIDTEAKNEGQFFNNKYRYLKPLPCHLVEQDNRIHPNNFSQIYLGNKPELNAITYDNLLNFDGYIEYYEKHTQKWRYVKTNNMSGILWIRVINTWQNITRTDFNTQDFALIGTILELHTHEAYCPRLRNWYLIRLLNDGIFEWVDYPGMESIYNSKIRQINHFQNVNKNILCNECRRYSYVCQCHLIDYDNVSPFSMLNTNNQLCAENKLLKQKIMELINTYALEFNN